MPRFVHVPSPEPGSLRHRQEGVGETARFDGCPGRRREDEPPLLPRRPGASPPPDPGARGTGRVSRHTWRRPSYRGPGRARATGGTTDRGTRGPRPSVAERVGAGQAPYGSNRTLQVKQ
jgi:hypothetical protein